MLTAARCPLPASSFQLPASSFQLPAPASSLKLPDCAASARGCLGKPRPRAARRAPSIHNSMQLGDPLFGRTLKQCSLRYQVRISVNAPFHPIGLPSRQAQELPVMRRIGRIGVSIEQSMDPECRRSGAREGGRAPGSISARLTRGRSDDGGCPGRKNVIGRSTPAYYPRYGFRRARAARRIPAHSPSTGPQR